MNNQKMNYYKKYKTILKCFIIALPILLLLIACIFPTKQIDNTYNGTITTDTILDSDLSFNQLNLNGNFANLNNYDVYNGQFSVSDNVGYLRTINVNNSQIRSNLPLSIINHKVIIKFSIARSNVFEIRYRRFLNDTSYTEVSSEILNFTTDSYNNFEFYYSQCNFNVFGVNVPDVTNDEFLYLKNFQCFDLTQMFGVGNEPTLDRFNQYFNEEYYQYNLGTLYPLRVIETTNTINDTDNIITTNETKQPNEAILKPLNLLYKADINNWYDSILDYFNINYDDHVYYYLLHFPLYVLWFELLSIILDILILVPKLVDKFIHRIRGDD